MEFIQEFSKHNSVATAKEIKKMTRKNTLNPTMCFVSINSPASKEDICAKFHLNGVSHSLNLCLRLWHLYRTGQQKSTYENTMWIFKRMLHTISSEY